MTSAAKHFGKDLSNFWKAPATQEYVQALASSVNLTDLELIQAIPGNRYIADRGTWAHPKLAVFFARWLDVRFSVWCDSVIDELLRGKATVVSTPALRRRKCPPLWMTSRPIPVADEKSPACSHLNHRRGPRTL